jgi:hypothetical protein
MRAASPDERRVLIQQARAAVDVQPGSLQEAFGGTAGREAQTAVAAGAAAYDKAESAAQSAEAKAEQGWEKSRREWVEADSEARKRDAEVKKFEAQAKKINQEAKKLEKDLEKLGRRAKSGSALSKGHFTVMKMISQYPGDKISDKIVTAFADKKFISDVEKALPKNAARVYVRVLKQHRTLLNKAGDSGGQDESKILMSNQLSVKEGRKMLSKIDDLQAASQRQLIAAAVASGMVSADDAADVKLSSGIAAKMKTHLKDARRDQVNMIDNALGGGTAAPAGGVDLNISKKFSREDLLRIGAE